MLLPVTECCVDPVGASDAIVALQTPTVASGAMPAVVYNILNGMSSKTCIISHVTPARVRWYGRVS